MGDDDQFKQLMKYFYNFLNVEGNSPDFMQNISAATRFWSHQLQSGYVQSDFKVRTNDLIYGSGIKVVNGQYNGSFRASDLISTFRISASVYTASGAIGFVNTNFDTVNPVDFTFDCPQQLIAGDQYVVPVKITNLLRVNLTGQLFAIYNDEVIQFDNYSDVTRIPPNVTSFIKNITITALKPSKQSYVKIVGIANTSDNVSSFFGEKLAQFQIIPRFSKKTIYQSGQIGSTNHGQSQAPNEASMTVQLPTLDYIDSVQGLINFYPSFLSYVYDASQKLNQDAQNASLEDLLSTIEVNIMLIQELAQAVNSTGGNPYVVGKLLEAISGVAPLTQQLSTYQVLLKNVGNGFDFIPGQTTGDESITAYALRVANMIPELFNSTNASATLKQNLAWLYTKKAKSLVFTESKGLNVPINITNAFTIWCLTQVNLGNYSIVNETLNLITTTKATYANTTTVLNSDPYLLALTILAAVNANRTGDVAGLAAQLAKYQDTTTGAFSATTKAYLYTPFNSQGQDRITEATAFAVLALAAADKQNVQLLYTDANKKATAYLLKQQRNGGFGNAQATLLVLNVLRQQQNPRATGSSALLMLYRGNQSIAVLDYDDDVQYYFPQRIAVDNSLGDLNTYANTSVTFKIAVTDNENAEIDTLFGYQASYTSIDPTYTGTTVQQSALNFTVTPTYKNGSLGVGSSGSTYGVTLALTNIDKIRGLGTAKVVLRPPSCLTIDLTGLKTLQTSGKISSYQINNSTNEITIYFRSFLKAEVKTITVNYVQAKNGKCKLRPYSASLTKNAGQEIVITPRF